jgi:hypothetical protein
MLPPYKLCLVRWADAHSPSAGDTYTANDLDAVHRAITATTCGFLLRDDDFGVTVASEWLGGQEFRGLTIIPRGMVVEVVACKTVQSRKRSKGDPKPPTAPAS